MTDPANIPMMWRYHEGSWSHVPDPHVGEDPAADLEDAGFDVASKWGFGLPDVEIYEHGHLDLWRVDVCIDGQRIRTIEVTRLPDLLDLLAKLAAISTASLLSGVSELAEPALLNLGEDAKAERDRRTKRPGPRS